MPSMRKDEARKVLAPYHDTILRIIQEAFAEYRRLAIWRAEEGMPAFLYPRTAANIVFDGIATRVQKYFGPEDRVSVVTEAQTVKAFFGGCLVGRFKKAGEDSLGQNIRTQAALAFMDADGDLPGMPPDTAKVEFIWVPNEIMTKIEQVLVVARDGDKMLWSYDIKAADDAANLVPFPEPPPEGPEDDNADLITPKLQPGEMTAE